MAGWNFANTLLANKQGKFMMFRFIPIFIFEVPLVSWIKQDNHGILYVNSHARYYDFLIKYSNASS